MRVGGDEGEGWVVLRCRKVRVRVGLCWGAGR